MYLKSTGWKALTVDQICCAVAAYRQNRISYKALRTYFLCAEMAAAREAKERCGRGTVDRRRSSSALSSVPPVYRRPARELLRAGFITASAGVVELVDCRPGSSLAAAAAGSGRSPRRLVPLPREMLRFLAGCRKPALALTVIAYCLRGLSIRGREINSRGSVKASWIAETFGLSLRAIRSARAELISLNWIARDDSSSQRKLNRTGAYFEINLQWCRTVDNFVDNQLKNAPPAAVFRTESAPPIKRLDNSSKTRKLKSGFWGTGTAREGRTDVSIWNVQKSNLFHLGEMGELYRQAVRRGLLRNSEANSLNFLACAIRARRLPNSCRIFMGLLKQNLWRCITQNQEDRARAALQLRRESEPNFMRL